MFWLIALASNIASGAQITVIMWHLGSPDSPVFALVVYQITGLVGGIAGVTAGQFVLPRLGVRRTLICSGLIEAATATGVAVAALALPTSSGTLPYVLAALMGVFAGAAGIGGPAWLEMVATWPETQGGTSQLLLDNVQFQIGLTLGPLIGAAALSLTDAPLAATAALNMLSFLCVAGILARQAFDPPLPIIEKRPIAGHIREFIRLPALWGVTGLALSAGVARIYLSRLIQASHGNEVLYSVCLTVMASAAVVTGLTLSRLNVRGAAVAGASLTAIALGIVLWLVALRSGFGWWLAGAVLVGAGDAAAYANLANKLRDVGGARATGVGMATRSLSSAAGAAIFAGLITLLGPAAIGLACIPALIGAVAQIQRRTSRA